MKEERIYLFFIGLLIMCPKVCLHQKDQLGKALRSQKDDKKTNSILDIVSLQIYLKFVRNFTRMFFPL